MTSERQFMKVCDCGIVLDANSFYEILGLRRIYVLHIAVIRNLISGALLMKLWLGLCFLSIKSTLILHFCVQF